MKTWISETRAILIAFSGAVAFLWFVGKPHAENFIKDTVGSQGYASKLQLDEANRVIKQNKAIANDVRDRSLRMETRQETILQLLKELRDDQRRRQ